MIKKFDAAWGELRSTSGSIEQGHPEFLLQRSHMASETRLSHAKKRKAHSRMNILTGLHIAVALHFTGLRDVADRPPTRAVVFARQREFVRVVDRVNTLGYTSTTLRNNRMVDSGGNLNVAQRHIMFHGYVHYLLRSATNENHPSWYDEGLADMLMVWNSAACEGEDEAGDRKEQQRRKRDEKKIEQHDPEVCRARYLEAKQAYERGLQVETQNSELRSGLDRPERRSCGPAVMSTALLRKAGRHNF